MDEVEIVLWIIAMIALTAASLRDLKDRLIPNEFVLVVLCAGIGIQIDNGFSSAALSIFVMIAVAACVYFLASWDYIGWGDAKMIAAVMLLVPARAVLPLLFDIAIAGGALSCLYILARMGMGSHPYMSLTIPTTDTHRPKDNGLVRSEMARIAAHEPLPYALAIWGGLSFWILCQSK